MRGSVIKRGTSWSYVVYLGRDAEGRKRQKWKGGFPTKRAAEDALTETLERIRTGNFVDTGRKTVGEFLTEWLAAASPGLRPSTASSYEHVLNQWLIPRIGGVRLAQLGPLHITELHESLRTGGRGDGRGGLSTRSVIYAHRVLSRALADAVRWGLVPRNVATLVSTPRLVTAEMKVWSAGDARKFLEGVTDDRLYAMWLLFVMTGMRRGEVLGLRWQDVDLANGSLAIRQTLVEVGYKSHFSEPKTKRSRRSVSIDPGTCDVLARHRERHESERLPIVDTGDLVFTQPDGRPLQPQNVSQSFQNKIRRLGLPPIRLHDLRHTSATLALAAGIHPKVVSERLGHSSIAITLDTYSHVVPGLQEAAASTLASLVLGDG
jgi:integrase